MAQLTVTEVETTQEGDLVLVTGLLSVATAAATRDYFDMPGVANAEYCILVSTNAVTESAVYPLVNTDGTGARDVTKCSFIANDAIIFRFLIGAKS